LKVSQDGDVKLTRNGGAEIQICGLDMNIAREQEAHRITQTDQR